MRNSVLCYLEDTVNKYSDKIAITDKDEEISFGEWKNMGLCLAKEISEKLQGNQCPVLVYLPKSVKTLISFVGILYSGNYYTPTDITFPFEKVNSIIKCLMPQLIITDKRNAKILLDNGVDEKIMLIWEDVDFSQINIDSHLYLSTQIDSDIAYVFFTSGSTGVPKGVSITHRSIIDYIDWAADKFSISEKEIIANQAPFYFDNSILDIYLCMSKGAHLYITPERLFSFVPELMEYINEHRISFIFWVPSALINVANSGVLNQIECPSIRKVLFCGEVMPNRHLNYWRKVLPDVLYANLYGPTEITDVCSYYIVDREFSDDEALPIGNACENTQILLLDEEDNLITQTDVMGELCVRGTCLSVGYYNNPQKTAEVFVQNPLNKHCAEKIYRTGDLAHYNEFGEIMFDGRKDFQIKHNGYRIELGEIETAIISIQQVEHACCVYDNEKREIVAFCKISQEMDTKTIRKYLLAILPKYMIPTRYVFLNELPYNDNGKIDRKKLKKEYID